MSRLTGAISKQRVVFEAIADERENQDLQWGTQDHQDGTGERGDQWAANNARVLCQRAFNRKLGTWAHIFREEVAEAMAESDPVALREELVQCAAVIVAWVEAIDRRRT